ncbi:hypothetical protein GQ457_03G020750 [Hibiscus cannabinus]
MVQVADHGVPLEASGLPKPPNLAHHLENASEPVHIELEEMAGDNISAEIVGIKRVSTAKKMQQQFALQGRYPCDIGVKGDSLPPRDIVYKKDNKLFGLRDKLITQQDALSKFEDLPR